MKIEPFPGTPTKQIVDRPFTTRAGRTGCQHVYSVVLTEEQEDWFRHWFPIETNRRLVAASGIKLSTLHRLADDIGLSKDPKALRRNRKRAAAHVKRVCERNGHYDRIRGRKPSEQTRQAVAKMWQDVREGKRENPIKAMWQTNPKKYRQRLEHSSTSFRELYRKERLREELGLRRQTKLLIVEQPYTKRQIHHRHHALLKGYFYMEDCSEQSGERYNIYYDEKTKRSEKFERNLQNDGFTVIEWKD